MDAERWERVKQLFEAALEREEPERSTYLLQECQNDEELRLVVQSLLSGQRNAGDFLREPTGRVPVTGPTSESQPPTFSRDQIISGRFKVLRFIAHGGMGEVYEARDLRRDVRVALKTIRTEIASDPKTLARFKREIELALRVAHRNVCRVHDLEHHLPPEGSGKPEVVFLTMELLEGETLANRLRRQGKMTCPEALPLIRQLADGLAAAHQVGVVHCDFKPGNVMLVSERPADVDSKQSTESVTPGQVALAGRAPSAGLRVVITDFGLARATRPTVTREAAEESLHTGGRLVGTLPYMAPEQLEGREATPASDVYALGLVIYEMVTGHQPFPGDPYNRLRQPPPSPRVEVPDVDQRCESVVLRCLQTDPGARYASASDVVVALTESSDLPHSKWSRVLTRSVAITVSALLLAVALIASNPRMRDAVRSYLFGPPIPTRKNLVVLPFRAVEHSEEEEARCDGFTETVTATLSQAPSVEVAPAESVRERRIDSFTKARNLLGANLVLYASWQQVGNATLINLVLAEVDSKHEKQLRTETVKGTIDDVSNLQDQVVLTALRMLRVVLSPSNEKDLTTHGTNVLTAYDFYVQGIGYLQNYERPASLDSAITLFKRAIEQDRGFAQAQAALAKAYWYKFTTTKNPEWAEQAKATVREAEMLNSQLPDVQLAIGEQDQETGAYADALSAYRRALDLDPENVDAYEHLGGTYAALGRTAEAEQAFRRAIEIRPSCWNCHNNLGGFLYDHARYKEAALAWAKVIDLAPDNPWGYMNVGAVYLYIGEFDRAADYFRRGLRVAPDDPDLMVDVGTVGFFEGRYDEDVGLCEKAIQIRPQRYDYWGNLGDAYRMIPGESSKAIQNYRQAIMLAEKKLVVNPKSSEVLSDLALYWTRAGDPVKGRKYLSNALEIDPNDVEILRIACLVHLEIGERKEALKWLERAVGAGYPRRQLVANPELASLHADPKFQQLATKAKVYE